MGWARKDYKDEIKDKPVYLINAYESSIRIYDMHKIKELVASIGTITEDKKNILVAYNGRSYPGRTSIKKDGRFGGYAVGINFPFDVVRKFEITNFKEEIWK